MQHEVLSILAEAHDYDSYVHKLESARIVLAGYEERLASGKVEIKDLVVSSLTKSIQLFLDDIRDQPAP